MTVKRPPHGGYPDAPRDNRPIMLQIASADEQHKLQQRRLAFLREWFKDEVVHFTDAGGTWTINDFFAYAAQVIGEPA